MMIWKRSLVLSMLLTVALIVYSAVRYYSPALIQHVVEQALIQKAPDNIEVSMIQQRLAMCLKVEPDKQSRLRRLLQISAYLEKVQHLTTEEWNELLTPDGSNTP